MQELEQLYIAKRLGEIDCPEPLLEIGAGWDVDFHQKPFRDAGFTQLFSHDLEGTHDFRGDICDGTDIPDGFAGTVLLFNVLEHVPEPWKAVEEVRRITRTGGILLGATPLRTALHYHPGDYYRYCAQGLAVLLRRFELILLTIDGDVGLPGGYLFAGRAADRDMLDHNMHVIRRPEIVTNRDSTLVREPYRSINMKFRRYLSRSFEKWEGPWVDRERMQQLGYDAWTIADYS
jgi:SAM-dependent methyltransferase